MADKSGTDEERYFACLSPYSDSEEEYDSEQYFTCREDVSEDDVDSVRFATSNGVSWVIDSCCSRRKRRKKRSLKEKKVILDSPSTSSIVDIENVRQRKVLDIRRWHCISRPQYKKSCGASSVVSVWNFLFTTLGSGCLPPITQGEALKRLGFEQPFGEIRFGPFTGNMTLLRWFRQLCKLYNVKGRCSIMYKPFGRYATKNISSENALDKIKSGLTSDSVAFIYHCYNHYFCPIGYEETPDSPEEAYEYVTTTSRSDPETIRNWILIGETSKKFPPMHLVDWNDIDMDLNCRSPQFLNIRHLELGIQSRAKKKEKSEVENEEVTTAKGGNLHCIMRFARMNS